MMGAVEDHLPHSTLDYRLGVMGHGLAHRTDQRGVVCACVTVSGVQAWSTDVKHWRVALADIWQPISTETRSQLHAVCLSAWLLRPAIRPGEVLGQRALCSLGAAKLILCNFASISESVRGWGRTRARSDTGTGG